MSGEPELNQENRVAAMQPQLAAGDDAYLEATMSAADRYYQPGAPARHAADRDRRLDLTYTWLPFGGGRRRCLGASFALLEMRVVLRAVAERFTVTPAGPARQPRRRMITLTPGDGGTARLAHRVATPEPSVIGAAA